MGSSDWDEGLGCGTCAELEYQGNIITVNVVDRWEMEEVTDLTRDILQMLGMLQGLVRPRRPCVAGTDWQRAPRTYSWSELALGHVSRRPRTWQHTRARQAGQPSLGCQIPGDAVIC